jgi:hypothetical protein
VHPRGASPIPWRPDARHTLETSRRAPRTAGRFPSAAGHLQEMAGRAPVRGGRAPVGGGRAPVGEGRAPIGGPRAPFQATPSHPKYNAALRFLEPRSGHRGRAPIANAALRFQRVPSHLRRGPSDRFQSPRSDSGRPRSDRGPRAPFGVGHAGYSSLRTTVSGMCTIPTMKRGDSASYS